MKKGFSIAALVATVTIMVILISVATISANNMSKNTKASNFAVEINSIEQAVNSYIQSNPNDYPILNSVTIDVSTIGDANKAQFTNNGDTISNNQITLFEIDYNKINYGNLKYGTKKDGTNDVYLFSTVTNKVYYAKGFKAGNKAYYTLTDELKKKISYKTTESLVEDSKTTVSSVPEIKQDKTNEGYAKEGLILHYDGRNNTGNGHDSKATSWKDLSGNGNDGILYNVGNMQNSGWNKDYLALGRNDDYVLALKTNSIDQLLENGNITVEVVFDYIDLPVDSVRVITNVKFAGGNPGKALYLGDYGENMMLLDARGNYAIGRNLPYVLEESKKYRMIARIAYNNGNTTTTIYMNNDKLVNATQNNNKIINNAEGIVSIGGIGGSYNNNVNVYSVRIYDRALTDEEIKQNYNVDKSRFGI